MHHIPIQVTEMTQVVVTILPIKSGKVNSALKRKVQLSSRLVRKKKLYVHELHEQNEKNNIM